MPCAFISALMLIYALWPEPKTDLTPLPSPNGYDDFIKAGQLLTSTSGDFTKMTTEELKSLISTNQEPLRLVRLGLERECRVPTEDSMAYCQSHINDLPSVKRVAQLLSAEGRLAEVEERLDEAAKIHMEVMLLGQTSAHGGLVVDKLVGVAVENIGLVGLERIAHRLNAPSCRKAISSLEEIDARADSAAVYIKRDRQWGRKATGTSDLSAWIQSALLTKSFFRNIYQKFTTKLLATERRRRLLLLNLASRAYELEHGKRPSRAEELVPSVLRAIPKDPETGTNLVLNPAL